MSNRVHALVLAAGGASRFGGPKQLARLDGRTLLQCVLDQARAVCQGRVGVVLGAYVDQTRALCEGVDVVNNLHWRDGLASSLRAGVEELPATADAVLVMLCDQPAIVTEQYAALVSAWCENPTVPVAASYAGTLGVPAVFPRRLFSDLCALRGDQGARAVLAKHAAQVVSVSIPEAARDVDFPEDLRR